jgi:hypothetical protein
VVTKMYRRHLILPQLGLIKNENIDQHLHQARRPAQDILFDSHPDTHQSENYSDNLYDTHNSFCLLVIWLCKMPLLLISEIGYSYNLGAGDIQRELINPIDIIYFEKT